MVRGRYGLSIEAVKPFGVVAKNLWFGVLRNVLSRTDCRNDVREHSIPVWVVRSKNNVAIPDALNGIGKARFLRFSRKKPISALHVLTRFRFQERRFGLALLPLFIHAVHPVWHPADTTFQERNAQVGTFLGYAAIHESGAIQHRFKRPADRVLEQEGI